MNHQGLRWNVHCVANVGLRKRLNLVCKLSAVLRSMFFLFFVVLSATRRISPLGQLGITQSVVFSSQTLLEHKYMRTKLRVLCSFFCGIYAFFWF